MSLETQTQSLWQYVANLRPQLRSNIQVYTHIYRHEKWYVLHDKSSGQYLRFNERAYSVIGRFNANLSLDEIYEYVNEPDAHSPIEKDEIISLLGQLNAAEVLKEGLPLDAQDIFRQYKSQKQKKRQRALMNPLSIKIPLLDPDKILNSLIPIARLTFTPMALWIWIATVCLALVLTLVNISPLIHDIEMMTLSPTQLITFWILYPIIKAMHELGHGLALKIWGGEVHEAGINLLLFMPVPYVDATSSLGFHNKWRRMTVGAAGIFFELFLAALSLFVWLIVEPGLVKDISLNIMLLASLSTLLFNGNPLLRYDGYFIFEDFLEIPNLATRAKRYYYYLFQKYLLKAKEVVSPVTAYGEEKWFLFYGFFSPLYRLVILFSIALYLSDSFLVVGVALAFWVVLMQLIIPLVKAVLFLLYSKLALSHRKQSIKVLVASIVTVFIILIIPVPTTTYTQGIVSTLGESQITAGVSGFVKEVYYPSGTQVKAHALLIQLIDHELESKQKVLQAKITELNAKIGEQQAVSRVHTEMLKDDLHAVQSEFNLVSLEVSKLSIYAQNKGEFVLASKKNLLGQFMKQGEVLAYIIDPHQLIIKALVPQARIGLLQSYDTSAQLVLKDQSHRLIQSKIIHEVPQAITQLPNLALSSNTGGEFITDPSDKSGLTLMKPMFQIDLELPNDLDFHFINSRVDVRLDHGNLCLAQQLALSLNQLFLRHFYSQ